MNHRFTFASLFTGGGGWDLGLTAAGGVGVWGCEWVPAIAAVARQNGITGVIEADVRVLADQAAGLPAVDVLATAPQCTRASCANVGATESDEDRTCAVAICRFLYAAPPRVFLLENESFPDTYALPPQAALAGRIIGGAVPVLLAQRIMESLL